MIKINDRDFDWDAIQKLYNPSSVLVSFIKQGSDGKGGVEKACQNGHPVTERLFKEWFLDPSTGIASEYRISGFLLHRDPVIWIESYAESACETLWGDKRLGHALLRWEGCVAEAKMENDKEARLMRLSSILGMRHINAGMFELRDSASNQYRPLESLDLKSPVRNKTLCSNKNRLDTLRLTKRQALIDFQDDCKKIFKYTDYISGKTRHSLLNAMRVSVCPYCNRQFISPWGTEPEKKNTADIDHYYSKDNFPFLALSLYNFVPSCQICNSRFKLTKDFYASPHANPHKKGFGNQARFEIENIEALLDSNVLPNLHINNRSGADEINRAMNTFHLEELYENHRDYAKEIIQKAKMFDDTQLREYLDEYYGLFSSKREMHRTIYGNYLEEENQGRRPLSKLTQDLLFDLGIDIGDD